MKVHESSFGAARAAGAASQDAFEVKAWGETVIAVVSDGAGGARAGGEASQRAVSTMVTHYEERPRAWSPQRSLGEFTRLINQRLYHDSVARYGAPEMIATLSVAVLEGDRLYGLNVGDSRVYLSHGGRLEQLSTDHVLAEEGYRHVLSRALGMAEAVEPQLFERTLHDGDLALLCTDGVSNVLNPATLAARLHARCSARSLVATAREKAAPETLDDMSAIVLDIAETGRLRAASELPLPIPETLRRGDEIDGFILARPFQDTDRVWLATRAGARYVLKFAPVEARDHEPYLHAFVREAWHATRLASSPHVVHAFVPEGASARYYAMQFIDAPTLKTLLRTRRLGVEEAVALGRFLVAAAGDLLRLDLVHGDIKPENILILPGYASPEYRLIDFGSMTELFSTNSRAGTASYLAPERFHENPVSERTELFAIGATLYEALTGSLPFGEIERFQTPRFCDAKDPVRLNPNIPGWLRAVLLRATAPQPERRYQNYSELGFDLERPAQVEPFHRKDAPLLERNPLGFYRTGFFLLLALTVYLLMRLLACGG